MRIRNQISYRLSGRYALWADPITRIGGEKFSYLVPTYQALKGITESIYAKPSIIWIVDEVRILNPIRTEARNIRPISYDRPGNTLSIYTYLADVAYEVRAHFIPNPYRTEPDLIEDGKNENKHHNIARRQVERGGRRDIFLGTRECQGYVEPCEYGKEAGYYDNRGEIDLGLMVHGFNYPDETGKNELSVRLWRAKMVDGIIRFPKPEDCDPQLTRYIRPMTPKAFGGKYRNFMPIDKDEALLADAEGREIHGMDAEAL